MDAQALSVQFTSIIKLQFFSSRNWFIDPSKTKHRCTSLGIGSFSLTSQPKNELSLKTLHTVSHSLTVSPQLKLVNAYLPPTNSFKENVSSFIRNKRSLCMLVNQYVTSFIYLQNYVFASYFLILKNDWKNSPFYDLLFDE